MSPDAVVRYAFRDFALAEGPDSFMQEHPLNVNLRDNGIGLVPHMSGVDYEARSGSFACGPIMAHLSIPFGWHIVDDGRRTLVFDEGSATQVNFELMQEEGLTDTYIVEQIVAQQATQIEGADWGETEVCGMKAVAIRDIPMSGEFVYQLYVVKRGWDADTWLVVRATCRPDDAERVLKMVEIVLASVEWPEGF